MTCAHPANRRICRDAITFCDACGSILPPPSHSREEPAGLSDPAPASGGPAAAGGVAAGSGGAACDHRDTARHTRDDGVTVCAFCGASLGWGAETWSNGVPNWHLDPAAPSSPPAASISRAAAEGRAGSLVAQAEAVGIRPIPGAASGWPEAVAELRAYCQTLDRHKVDLTALARVSERLDRAEQANQDAWLASTKSLRASIDALHHRLDQSSEAWTGGVARFMEHAERLRAEDEVLHRRMDAVHQLTDRVADLEHQAGALAVRLARVDSEHQQTSAWSMKAQIQLGVSDPDLGSLQAQIESLRFVVSGLQDLEGARAKAPPDGGELAAVRERIRIVAHLLTVADELRTTGEGAAFANAALAIAGGEHLTTKGA